MSTLSFSDIKNQPAEETNKPAAAETTAVAEPAKQELAKPVTAAIPAGIEGEIERTDVKLPRLNLIQKMSDLVNAGFMPNTFALNKEIPLGKSLEVVVVRLKKQFQLDQEYGSDADPVVFDTLAEVREYGGSTEWGAEVHFSEIAHMQLLIKAPKDLDDDLKESSFPYEVDGESWAPAAFTAAKSAYKAAAKPVITAAFGVLRSGLHNGLWTVVSEDKKNAMGSWSVPSFKLTGRTSPEMAALVESLLQG